MRMHLQRVCSASVTVSEEVVGSIDHGILVLLGVTRGDSMEDVSWLAKKLLGMRIFNDEAGKMNKSVCEVNGGILIISQFTLFASTKKGNRPSFINAASPELAKDLYELFVQKLSDDYLNKLDVSDIQNKIQTGVFGADMRVHLTNDGPVTILVDSKNRE